MDEPQPSFSGASPGQSALLNQDDASASSSSSRLQVQPAAERRLHVEEIRWSLVRLREVLSIESSALSFAEDRGLLPRRRICRVHKCPMKIYFRDNAIGYFVCTKSLCKGKRLSRAAGTFFENTKLSVARVLYLMYCFAKKFSYERTQVKDFTSDTTCLSSRTISRCYNYCRETIVLHFLQTVESRDQIGGLGKIVQIDECKFARRKYSKGRWLEGHWVLGMVEDGSDDLRLEVRPDNIRSPEVLVPIIQKHIKPGTIVRTDCWKTYDCLNENGYIHRKENHYDPDSPFIAPSGTRTRRIESHWRVVKRALYYDRLSIRFADRIVEFQWRRNVENRRKDPFEALLTAINHVYGNHN